jgi:glyoxylase-like metal-dependent hydrolase (beta-lactamase superfamily II)
MNESDLSPDILTPEALKPLVLGAIATNCYIIPLNTPPALKDSLRPCAIIDPGDQASVIIARMEKSNLRARYILLTHGHFDHIAALPDLAAAFPEAEIAIHREDAVYLGPAAHAVHCRCLAAAGDTSFADRPWKDMPAPARLLEEGDALGPFRVLHLPGHTPGSAGFSLPDHKILFSGDTLFEGAYGRTDLPGGDWGRLVKSLERLFGMDKDIRVFPGHGPATNIGRESRRYRG